MAKKIKPVSDECLMDNSSNKDELSEQSNEVQFNVQNIVSSNLTRDQVEKLEKYSQLETVNKQLIKENSELRDRIAEYLVELDKLRANKCVDKTSSDIELAQLKIDYKTLQDASDGYLMRISELTFENAKLNAQLNEISNKSYGIQCSENQINKKSNTAIERPVYNPYKQNGYSSWN